MISRLANALSAFIAPGVTREEIARAIEPHWFGEDPDAIWPTGQRGRHCLDNYPGHHQAMQKAAYEAADRVLALLSPPTMRLNPMSDALEVLRAKVEAATAGDWQAWKSPENVWTVRTKYRDSLGLGFTAWPAVCDCGAQPNEANAALIVAAVNLAKRLCTDKSVADVAKALEAARACVPLYHGKTDTEFYDGLARAAIRAILGGQP